MTESDTRPQPPGSLGERGSALWHAIVGAYDLRPDELAILYDAAGEADVIELLQAEFNRRDLITRGSMGQDVAAPHVSEIRQHRATLASLLGKLRLPDEGVTNNAWHRSVAARHAANARWNRTAPR